MEKIVVETKMKSMPEKCTDCKFNLNFGESKFNQSKVCIAQNYKPIKKVFVKEKNNWTYAKPDWCPLALYDVEEE